MSRNSLLARIRQVASPRKATKARLERVQKVNKVSKSLFGPVIKSEFRRWVGIELSAHNDHFIESSIRSFVVQIRSTGNDQISITSVEQVGLWLHQGVADYARKQSVPVGADHASRPAEILSSHRTADEINAEANQRCGRERPRSIIQWMWKYLSIIAKH